MTVYGVNPVIEALRAGQVSRVVMAPKGVASRARQQGAGLDAMLSASNPRLAEVAREARARGVAVEIVDAAALDRLARGGVHQGVAAVVMSAAVTTWTPETLVSGAAGVPLLVVLDGVEDPHNVGAILRSAEAAGASGVIRQTRRAAPLTGTTAKASAGAVAHLRIADVVNLSRALEALKAAGVWVVGLAGDAGHDYDRVDLTVPTALVLGAEGTGLRRLVRQHCDWLVRIPLRGRVSSLNVSVAAGVVLFEALRQRRARETRAPAGGR